MQQYLQLLDTLLTQGKPKQDRTNTGTLSLFGYQMRFNLQKGFPLLTTKKIHFKSVAHELLWFLTGNTNIAYLTANNVRIWNEWADEQGDLGPVYGKQWRSWSAPNGDSIDQIAQLMQQLKDNPDSRRHIVCSWNVADIEQMALPPCHCLFQFYVHDNTLSCQLYQRSADVFLGVPFNIASYALLVHLIAQQLNMQVGDFVWTGGDVHLYNNHQTQAKLQLNRQTLELCQLKLNKAKNLFSYTIDDIELINYTAHPHIAASVAV